MGTYPGRTLDVSWLLTSSSERRPLPCLFCHRQGAAPFIHRRNPSQTIRPLVAQLSRHPSEQHHLRDVQPAMSIKPLPANVVAQIKSSVVITSLNNVICGLIKNSLDAEATKINLSLDYSRGNCSVEDNGSGIPSSEFRDDGGLGQLHCK